MVAFARAEDASDLGGRLSDVIAPTLVVAGELDTAYPPVFLREAAEEVRDGRLVSYPRTGRGHPEPPAVPLGRHRLPPRPTMRMQAARSPWSTAASVDGPHLG